MLYILSDYNIYSLNSNFELENIEYLYGPKFIKKNLTVFKSFTKVYDYIYSANANGVAKINTETRSVEKIWDTRSTAITNSGKDSLWIGTTKGLFLRVNDNIIKFHLNKYFDSSIIYSLQQSPYGLLIGSNSHGFGILKNGNFNNVNTQNGLLSNYIKSIHLDSKNNIWLSTNLGLNCIQISNDGTIKKIISYTTSDGLYSNDVRGCYVDNEKVYIATSNGLNIIDLSKETNQNIAPRVHINTILVNNELVPKNKNHEFDNRLNNIQFNYSGISFKSSGNITFKYRLVGIEDDWIETTNNAIRYSSLPPKSYTFQLKAISKDGIESEQITTFSFKIRPPIYELWWFILLGAFFTLGLTALFLYRRILVIRQRREIKEKISALRYQALNAQMNPHFINNLMIRIENLTDRKEYSKVKDAVHNFAKLVNTILRATKNNLIPMSEEISMVELYIRLQNSRFENEIIFKTNTNSLSQEDLENILVPPMILQPIIENSLKHGFMNSEKQNRISINLKNENDDYLICEIIDNGIGIQNNNNNKISSSGISIKNINERLQLINHSKKEEEMIFISNITNEFNTLVGTKVTLKIPLISI